MRLKTVDKTWGESETDASFHIRTMTMEMTELTDVEVEMFANDSSEIINVYVWVDKLFNRTDQIQYCLRQRLKARVL